jgi:hypothetical protein
LASVSAKVAAGLALDGKVMQKKLNSGMFEPIGGFLECIFHGPADLDALGDQLEFLAHRAGHFGGDRRPASR